MLRDFLYLVIRTRDWLAQLLIKGNHASPDTFDELDVVAVGTVIVWRAAADLGAATVNFDAEDLGGLHLGAVWGDAGVGPPVEHDEIGDEFHSPQLLFNGRDEGRVAEQHDRAVVVAVGVWRQGEHEAINLVAAMQVGRPLPPSSTALRVRPMIRELT